MGAIFSRKSERRVLVLGLDNAGKTTLVTLFKEKEPPTKTVPTVGFDVKTFNTSKFKVNAWDVGGQDSIQHLWHHYFENTNALLYLVDSTDTVRLENSAASLKDSLSYPELRATPVLILCNKVDIEGALSPSDIAAKMGLQSLKHTWSSMAISAKTGKGCDECIQWLDDNL